jgi:hypothetical protein
MTTEVTKTEAQVPATSETLADLGFNSNDILIPRIMLMQNTSEYVGDEKFKLGDIIDSISQERLGGVGDALEVIPIHIFKTWRVYRVDGEFKARGGKLIKVLPVTAENEKLPWEGTEKLDDKDVPVRRDLSYNAFVILKKDLDSGSTFPLNIIFKRSGANAGKQLVSLIYRLGMMGTPIYGKSVLLNVGKQKKETNTYAVFEVKTGNLVSNDYFPTCQKWQSIVKTANVRVDDKDDSEEEEAPVKAPVVVTSVDESPY